jgi:ABC-2 type transport system permease protein
VLACYLRLIRAGFRRYATYRQAVLAGLATNVVFGFMRCAVLLTVFAGSASVSGYDPSRTVTFVWIGQGLIAVVLIWGNADFGERVRSGDISIDLLRPIDLQAALLAEDLGRAGFALLSRFSVPLLVGSVFFDLTLPGSVLRWAAFGLSVLLAGLAIPIAFFPGWAQVVIWATPFPAMLQAPIDVAIGRGAAAPLLAIQLAWTVLLLVTGRVVLVRAVRTLVIQGG